MYLKLPNLLGCEFEVFQLVLFQIQKKRASRINEQDPTNLTHCDVKSSWYNSMLGSNNCYILSIIVPFLLHL